jgi:hypothetical protein
MPLIDWNLAIAGSRYKGGSEFEVVAYRQTGGKHFLRIRPLEGSTPEDFEIYAATAIGGKNLLYLLSPTQADTLTVVRLITPVKILSMDPDRFSSLRNALALALAERMLLDNTQIAGLFGSG